VELERKKRSWKGKGRHLQRVRGGGAGGRGNRFYSLEGFRTRLIHVSNYILLQFYA
jgi:hypothetical protein